MFDDIDRFNDRLDKAEENALNNINRELNRDFRAIENYIENNYLRLRDNQSLIPDEKATSLFFGISNVIAQRDRSRILRDFYNRVSEEATRLNQGFSENTITPNNLNDPVDFWTLDSNNRINDWGNRFLQDIQGIFRFFYPRNASKTVIIAAIRERYGRLKSQVARVVQTGTTGVSGGTSDRFARANNRDFVVLKTTQDDIVCPYCAAREGNIYRVGEISLPLHPSCRCVLIPIDSNRLRDRSFLEQLSKFKQTAKDELKDAGGNPNYGVAPFEKKNGATDAPTPFFES